MIDTIAIATCNNLHVLTQQYRLYTQLCLHNMVTMIKYNDADQVSYVAICIAQT